MDFQAEATIVGELLKFATSGQLYRGAKPVMWSPVEKTALAEAEVEYEDITSTQIDVAFELIEVPSSPELVGTKVVIWTTTPWTIPTNQALAYGRSIDYLQIKVGEEKYLVAEPLIEAFLKRIDEDGYDFLMYVKGPVLAGAKARHPMAAAFPDSEFFTRPRPLLAGDFVTTDSGTGFVHMAPDHGEDDFLLCKANKINPVFAVEGDGKYRADWPWLGGEGSVINPKFNAPDGPICTALREAGGLLAASADYKHSYPHSWRSKAKVIFRCTPQWFVPMDKDLAPLSEEDDMFDLATILSPDTLRERAKKAIADTRFVPEKGRNRIGAMVEGRPDWVLSRQRAWGVPITLFVDRKSGQYLVDPAVNERIVAAIREEGVDAGRGARAGISGRRLQRRGLRARHRHSGRVVRFGQHPCFRDGKRPLARPAAPRRLSRPPRRPLSRRQRPASRLVPVLAARSLRHAWPCAVQGGFDPRFHHGRQGHENVQEPWQHGRSVESHGDLRRGHRPPLGSVGGLYRGSPHR
jgi:isoleucyl-tRNA synthetase